MSHGPMHIAAIDLDKLRAAAFAGSTPTAVCERGWLQSLYRALTGEPWMAITGAPDAATRSAKIMSAIDAVVQLPGAPA